MLRHEAENILREKFHLNQFYDEQWVAIDKLLRGERVLLIEKTGYGKSLCFQFPATLFDGLTVIFSPLIALMRDQVRKLRDLGISAHIINSEQSVEENTRIIEEAKQGKLKILYIAPERQENREWIDATRYMNLSMVVIDEAHCISIWGHDFRPAFRRIVSLVKLLPRDMPVLATTATATKRVEKDIADQIAESPVIIRGNLMRENFRLYVVEVESEDEKMVWLGANLEIMKGSGILYTGTRVDTEIYSRWLDYINISSTSYNAGLDPESRMAVEKGLIENKWKCVISTNALGMGIDKPDIRFIIHTQIPQSPIHYYQEIGRAGRDNLPATIILFYNPKDLELPWAFIEGSRPAISKYRKVIEAIKSELLGEREIMKLTNLKQNQLRVIRADLIDQGIIREVMMGRSKKYEYVLNAPEFNPALFENLKKQKTEELEKMVGYVETTGSRMKYLCEFLDDRITHEFINCDNTGLEKLSVDVTEKWETRLKDFRENYFPDLIVETANSSIINGVAASFYGVSNVGAAIHRCKYEGGGDYPGFLLKLTLKAFRRKFGKKQFDGIVYIPPTKSGDLVRNFALKIAYVLRIPAWNDLMKTRETKEQKVFENAYLKRDNVKDAFEFKRPELIKGKTLLLIDDIFDSGASIKEVGRYLTNLEAKEIAPLVIAKTVGGDLV